MSQPASRSGVDGHDPGASRSDLNPRSPLDANRPADDPEYVGEVVEAASDHDEIHRSEDQIGEAAPVAAPPVIEFDDGISTSDLVYTGVPVSPPIRIVDSDLIPPEPKPSLPIRIWLWIGSVAEWLFGMASLLAGLAVVSSIPILQFASLGYLLEASGRVARSGRIRDGFMGVRPAARIGGLIAGAWLVYLPLLLINETWYSAYVIDPTSRVTGGWRIGQFIATAVCVSHVVVAWSCGGRLRDYFWPLFAPIAIPWNWFRGRGLAVSVPPLRLLRDVWAGGALSRRRDAVWDFVVGLRLPHLFWLGLRGFAGAVAWLFVPISLLVVASSLPNGLAVLFSLAGAAILTGVLLYLPFLQAHFATKGEMVAMFDVGAVRKLFRKAPIAFWFSLLITLLFALPLYLLKIELTPSETLWIPSLVFVAFMFPARILTGWVMGLASRREAPRHFVFRWMSRLAQLPIVLAYVGIVYLTQYLSWYGVYSLFEQHVVLTPAPFLGG